MLTWALADHSINKVIELYATREEAEQELAEILRDEPEWEGMLEIVPHPLLEGWSPN